MATPPMYGMQDVNTAIANNDQILGRLETSVKLLKDRVGKFQGFQTFLRQYYEMVEKTDESTVVLIQAIISYLSQLKNTRTDLEQQLDAAQAQNKKVTEELKDATDNYRAQEETLRQIQESRVTEQRRQAEMINSLMQTSAQAQDELRASHQQELARLQEELKTRDNLITSYQQDSQGIQQAFQNLNNRSLSLANQLEEYKQEMNAFENSLTSEAGKALKKRKVYHNDIMRLQDLATKSQGKQSILAEQLSMVNEEIERQEGLLETSIKNMVQNNQMHVMEAVAKGFLTLLRAKQLGLTEAYNQVDFGVALEALEKNKTINEEQKVHAAMQILVEGYVNNKQIRREDADLLYKTMIPKNVSPDKVQAILEAMALYYSKDLKGIDIKQLEQAITSLLDGPLDVNNFNTIIGNIRDAAADKPQVEAEDVDFDEADEDEDDNNDAMQSGGRFRKTTRHKRKQKSKRKSKQKPKRNYR